VRNNEENRKAFIEFGIELKGPELAM